MNKTDYKEPGKVEKRVLQILSNRNSIHFMSLRGLFPIEVTEIEKVCNDLIKLGLITKNISQNETIYSLTDKGAQVTTHGLNSWIKKKVSNKIKNNPYVITKSTPNIERHAVRILESEREIFLDGKQYKIVPEQTLEPKIINQENQYHNLNGIIDKVLTYIYTSNIPFSDMSMEKTHKHEIRHVMNYLEEEKLVLPQSDPVKLTSLGIYVYNEGHDKWKREKEQENLIEERIKNFHLQNILNKKPKKTWINDWYNANEVIIKIFLGIATLMGVILPFFL
jgi:predicted transcriptional regulator